jgi:hypothetical protein
MMHNKDAETPCHGLFLIYRFRMAKKGKKRGIFFFTYVCMYVQKNKNSNLIVFCDEHEHAQHAVTQKSQKYKYNKNTILHIVRSKTLKIYFI